jgi:hypothetical protein
MATTAKAPGEATYHADSDYDSGCVVPAGLRDSGGVQITGGSYPATQVGWGPFRIWRGSDISSARRDRCAERRVLKVIIGRPSQWMLCAICMTRAESMS